MATIEDLSDALVNADKAGDNEASRILADAIVKLQSVDATQAVPEPYDNANMFRDATSELARGATFNLSDRVGALGGATGGALYNMATGQDANFGKEYDEVLAQKRAQTAAYQKAHPMGSLAASLTGAMMNPVNKVAGKFIGQGKNMATRAGRSGVAGVPIGAAYSATDAKEGEVVQDALIGGMFGGLLGAFATPAVEAGVGVARRMVQAALDRQGGALSAAQQKVSKLIMDMGGGDMKAGLAVLGQRLQKGGPDTAIVDVAGVNAQRAARGAAGVPGEASQMADDFVGARVAGRGDRLQSAADRLAPNDFYPEIEAISKARSAAAGPLYDEAFAPMSDKAGKVFAPWDERLQRFLNDPLIKMGLKKGIRKQELEALARNKEFNFQEYAVKGFDDAGEIIIDGTPNLRAMDAAKQGIDEILEGFRDKTTGKLDLSKGMAKTYDEVRRALVSKLDEITTDTTTGRSAYKDARDQWAGPSQLIDAALLGRKFAKGDEEITAKIIDGMSGGQKEAFRLGVRRELSKIINKDTQTAVNKFADKKVGFWNKLKAVFPDEQSLNAFRVDIGNELQKARTENFINPRAGSQTTPLAEDVKQMNRAPEWLTEALFQASTGNKTGAVTGALRAPFNAMTRPSQSRAKELADMLLELDPTKQRALMQMFGNRTMAGDVAPLLKQTKAQQLSQLLGRSAPSVMNQSAQPNDEYNRY